MLHNRSGLLLVAAALLLAGCGVAPESSGRSGPRGPSGTAAASTPAGAPTNQGFNSVDVMFLQMMVPHHEQGMAIARMAKYRPVSDEVSMLAAAIEVTQADEVATMSGWLRGWHQPPTADAAAHAAHGGMPGTSAAEMDALRRAPDDHFERDFLNVLLAHQDDAVQLARMETAGGVNTRVIGFAERVDKSRSAQIQHMLRFLDR